MTHEIFSAHMFKTFDECPKKFDLIFNQKLYLPQKNEHSEIGENIHTLANYYFKKFDITKMEKVLEDKEKTLWENLKNNILLKSDNYSVVPLTPTLSRNGERELCAQKDFVPTLFESEYNFTLRFGDYWLNGRVDAIFQDGDKFIIADWKTGSKTQNETDYQSMIYLYAIFEILKHKNLIQSQSALEFSYIYLSKNEEIRIEYSKEKSENYRKIIFDSIRKIEQHNVKKCNDTHDNRKCYTCNYKPLCYNYSNEAV